MIVNPLLDALKRWAYWGRLCILPKRYCRTPEKDHVAQVKRTKREGKREEKKTTKKASDSCLVSQDRLATKQAPVDALLPKSIDSTKLAHALTLE